jgi:hypothetical protein
VVRGDSDDAPSTVNCIATAVLQRRVEVLPCRFAISPVRNRHILGGEFLANATRSDAKAEVPHETTKYEAAKPTITLARMKRV